MPTVTSISCIALARQHLCRRCNASRHYGTRDEREQFRFSSGHGARNLESRTIVRSVVSRSPTIGVVSRAPTVRVERNPFSGSVAIKRRARKSRSTQLRDRKNSHVPVFIYCPDRADSVNQVLSPFGLSIPGYTSFSRAISSRATSREKERKISHGLRLERLRRPRDHPGGRRATSACRRPKRSNVVVTSASNSRSGMTQRNRANSRRID